MLAGDWYWDVNAAYGRNKAKQKMFGNINSAHLRQALGPVATAWQPGEFGGTACRSISSAVPERSRQEMMDFVTFVQHDKSKQTLLGSDCQLDRQRVRTARRAARPGGRASNIATWKEVSTRIRSLPPASVPTFRRSRPEAAITSRRPMRSSMRRCWPTCPSPTCSKSPARSASPIIRLRARPRPSRPG